MLTVKTGFRVDFSSRFDDETVSEASVPLPLLDGWRIRRQNKTTSVKDQASSSIFLLFMSPWNFLLSRLIQLLHFPFLPFPFLSSTCACPTWSAPFFANIASTDSDLEGDGASVLL